MICEMAMTESHGSRKAQGWNGTDRLCWPPLRSDVVALACFAIVTYCLLAERWPVLAIAALWGTVLSGLAPRLKDRWGIRVPGGELIGTFRDPAD
jgi:hypothetical protein